MGTEPEGEPAYGLDESDRERQREKEREKLA